MRRWEDIAKDKLEGYESRLPEGSLAEFRARRDGAGAARPRQRYAAVWALAGVAAVLAAVLLFWRPAAPDEGIRIVQQPPVVVPAAPDSSAMTEAPAAQPSLVAQAVAPQAPRPAVTPVQPAQPAQTAPEDEEEMSGISEVRPSREFPQQPDRAEASDAPFVPEDIPAFLLNSQTTRKTVRMSVGKAAGIVGGTTLLAAAVTLIDPSRRPAEGSPASSPIYMYPGHGELGSLPPQESIRSKESYDPLKVGLSVRIPVSGSLSVTTGLEYSCYKTRFEYITRFEEMQAAHYIGIPMRLDWTLASNRWLDVYVGGGFAVDACVGATLGGRPIPRDGFAFSLLGAGGIQFNLTRRVGIYLEPVVSWTAPSNGRVLATCRTASPVSLSFATGLRFNLGKQ